MGGRRTRGRGRQAGAFRGCLARWPAGGREDRPRCQAPSAASPAGSVLARRPQGHSCGHCPFAPLQSIRVSTVTAVASTGPTPCPPWADVRRRRRVGGFCLPLQPELPTSPPLPRPGSQVEPPQGVLARRNQQAAVCVVFGFCGICRCSGVWQAVGPGSAVPAPSRVCAASGRASQPRPHRNLSVDTIPYPQGFWTKLPTGKMMLQIV